MTSENQSTLALDTALHTVFGHAEKSMGLKFQELASSTPHLKVFEVKDPHSEKLIGLVTLNPFTTKTASSASHNAGDRTVSTVSLSLNLQKPAEGTTAVLDAQELNTLFKLSGHAFTALAAQKSRSSINAPKLTV